MHTVARSNKEKFSQTSDLLWASWQLCRHENHDLEHLGLHIQDDNNNNDLIPLVGSSYPGSSGVCEFIWGIFITDSST